MMRCVDAAELRFALESHTAALAAGGLEVDPPEVGEPATHAEIDEVEARLGFPIPSTLREAFVSVARSVRWSWRSLHDDPFDGPFEGIFSGGLDWSLDGLVAGHHDYVDWVENCFSNPDDPYDAVWHRKLGFAHVPNGDIISVDLDPQQTGAIVYLSHDDGEGHGYVLADSLGDLLDRWVPLACPGPEDGQWLPFVPHDFGPIDPAGDNGSAWRQLIGLTAAPPRTPPITPDDELFDALVARYRAAGEALEVQHLALRALRVCSTDRAEVVIGLLDTDDMLVQVRAAQTLGRWRWRPAIDDLKRIALTGSNYGRIHAILALRRMPRNEAKVVLEDLRGRLDEPWLGFLD